MNCLEINTPIEMENIKPKRGRKKIYEDVKQYYKENKYSNKYYHETREFVECEFCQRIITTRSLKKHHNSLICLVIKNKLRD